MYEDDTKKIAIDFDDKKTERPAIAMSYHLHRKHELKHLGIDYHVVRPINWLYNSAAEVKKLNQKFNADYLQETQVAQTKTPTPPRER